MSKSYLSLRALGMGTNQKIQRLFILVQHFIQTGAGGNARGTAGEVTPAQRQWELHFV